MAAISTAQERDTEVIAHPSLLIVVREVQPDAASTLLSHLSEAFAGTPVTIALPHVSTEDLPVFSNPGEESTAQVVSYKPVVESEVTWTLTALDYRNAFDTLRRHPAPFTMILGAEAESISPTALRGMYEEMSNTQCDLVTARYLLPARSGLVNSAILYPLSRALFGASPRFPLAIDACLSVRMIEKMDAVAQRATIPQQPIPFVWPVTEAVAAGFRVGQFDVGSRSIPQPTVSDLNEMISQVVGSCFADIEAKAAVWQRLRIAPPTQQYRNAQPGRPVEEEEIEPLMDGFRLAYTNLRDVWTLVLPPQTLLGLKRLSVATRSSFVMPDALWARIIYDFLLAFRLRTLNRSHLLGSLTPLYLAWLASHLSLTNQGVEPEHHAQQIAEAFEAEKPYLVARWRWPDRFNP